MLQCNRDRSCGEGGKKSCERKHWRWFLWFSVHKTKQNIAEGNECDTQCDISLIVLM